MLFEGEGRDILIIGSSTTAGTGPSSPDKKYTALLEAALPKDSFEIHAIGGTDVDDWQEAQIATMRPNNDIVIIQLAINAWLVGVDEIPFEIDARAMLQSVRSHNPIAEIYFLRAWMPRTSYDSQVISWENYREILFSFVGEINIRPYTFLDRFDSNIEQFYMPDQGIHYNDKGHQILAQSLLDFIGYQNAG